MRAHDLGISDAVSAEECASLLGAGQEEVFKTLVTVGKSGEHYVFMVPGGKELDLKKAARAAGEKSVEMIKQKELYPLTGYVHGGCSPLGMKKRFRTFIDMSVLDLDRIFFSAGRIGLQVETGPSGLMAVSGAEAADISV